MTPPGDLALRQATALSRSDKEAAVALAAAFLTGFSSERTRLAYATDLRKWFQWCE
jgi:hypothetical protein